MSEPAALPSTDEMLWVAAALEAVAVEITAGREIFISPALLCAAVRLLRVGAGELESEVVA